MSQEWPDIADVTAALESDDASATAIPTVVDPVAPATEADAAADKVIASIASKPTPTPAEASAEPAKKVDPAPSNDPASLAEAIKGDPRKFIQTLPEDAQVALGEVLYPGLHKVLSKRDKEHAAEVAQINARTAAQIAAMDAKQQERFDEILQRTMDPETFEELKRTRSAKAAEEEKQKSIPTAEEIARIAAYRAHTQQAWSLVEEEGFPLPRAKDFSDVTPEVQAIWAAGWEEPDPIKAQRAMRAKARELKSSEAAKPTPPRDPSTGKFLSAADIAKAISDGVAAELDRRETNAALSITGSRTAGNGSGNTGKAPTWEQSRAAMAEAVRAAQGR